MIHPTVKDVAYRLWKIVSLVSGGSSVVRSSYERWDKGSNGYSCMNSLNTNRSKNQTWKQPESSNSQPTNEKIHVIDQSQKQSNINQ